MTRSFNSTLPFGSQKVEYKFFIEVIERRYARVVEAATRIWGEAGIRWKVQGPGNFARNGLRAAS
jgi:paraquat-inducible protein B